MNNEAAYRGKAVIMEMMAAFSLFVDKGLAAVKRMYPQHVDFVKAHKNKTEKEVKKELLQKQVAWFISESIPFLFR